ncbi:hypothetical protein ACWDKQ_25760 [Saccharopolyspora sp. NPDC000995]
MLLGGHCASGTLFAVGGGTPCSWSRSSSSSSSAVRCSAPCTFQCGRPMRSPSVRTPRNSADLVSHVEL